MAHQMGQVLSSDLEKGQPTVQEIADGFAKEMAELKEVVRLQQLTISSLLRDGTSQQDSTDSEKQPGYCDGGLGLGDAAKRENSGGQKGVEDRRVPTEQQSKEIRHLLRDLKIDRGAFDPKTEAELDDITEDWEIQAEGFGHNLKLLIFVVNRVGSQTVREVASRESMECHTWVEFVDDARERDVSF